MPVPDVAFRVGELARRVGVSPETLRAWERRYGVLRPARTPAGYRIYGSGDEARALRMQALISAGFAAAQAARAVLAEGTGEPDLGPAELTARLQAALLAFDGEQADALLDRLLVAYPLPTVLGDTVLPVLRAIGEGWERGTVSVAQEHFAADLLGGRLRGLSRGWQAGDGPRAVLACPSSEQHDLGLLACGLALRGHGWRVTYLGADTPDAALRHAVDRVRPDAVVIAAVQSEPLARAAAGLAALAADARVVVGGAGARPSLVRDAAATLLAGDPVGGAAQLAAST